MKTIIAEKPSVAREIARIVGATKREEGYFEGGGYAVTWAFGHLVQLAMPDGYGVRGFVRDNLPIIPDTFTLVPRQVRTEKGYKPDSGVVSQIKVIKRLFDTSEHIIVATDAGREGELIFRYLYHYTGCTTPFVRLWISSLTDKAIREGLRKLEDGSKYDNLYLAAKARSESDWLVGINGTQALSIAAGHGTYSVGRVQTPTLAMVCERYWENRRFTSEAFWQLHIATVDYFFAFPIQMEVMFMNDLKKVLLAGIGLTAMTVDKADSFVQELVEKGRLTVEEGKELEQELKRQSKEGSQEFLAKLDAKKTSVEYATKDDVRRLEEKLDALLSQNK